MTPPDLDFMAVRVNKGIAYARFEGGFPVRCLSYPRLAAISRETLELSFSEWLLASQVLDARIVVIESTRNLHPDDRLLLELLGSVVDPEAEIARISPREWKAQAGGPFVTRLDVVHNATRRWPLLRIPNAPAAITLWLGAAYLASRSEAGDPGDRLPEPLAD